MAAERKVAFCRIFEPLCGMAHLNGVPVRVAPLSPDVSPDESAKLSGAAR